MFSVNNLFVAYGQSEVLHGVSFEVKPEETVAVMGRNGMGKTTLMKSMIGILRAKGGAITVGGKDLTAKDSFQRVREGVAFVPQGRQIFSVLTVEENILTGLEAGRRKTVDPSIYDTFPVLKEMRKRRGGNLSGGQQQQLAMARALASDPKVLLLDEPTEGIQPSIIKDMAVTLNKIKADRKLAIVVSEQVLSFALEIADRVIVIESGNFVHESPRSAVDADKVAKFLSV